MIVKPDAYEEWYDSARGRWIGSVEFSALESQLRPRPGASLLDIGCGTGHFTRLFAAHTEGLVVGLDPNQTWINYANTHTEHAERYVIGRAESLPFPDRSFDLTISVTALCFVKEQELALRELIRVTRQRFVLGLLNRRSLLYLKKGRRGGVGAYRGARWHTPAEVRALFAALPVGKLRLSSAIVSPHATWLDRVVERYWPQTILLGGFLVVTGEILDSR